MVYDIPIISIKVNIMKTKPTLVQYATFVATAILAIVVTYQAANKYFDQKRIADNTGVASEVNVTAPTSQTELEPSAHFISVCAGMDITVKGVWLSAVSECLGRVRGFVDAHNLMVAMAQRMGNRNAEAIQLFCVDQTEGSDKILTSIMDWTDAHRNEYIDTIEQTDPQNAATIIMIKALKSSNTCANT